MVFSGNCLFLLTLLHKKEKYFSQVKLMLDYEQILKRKNYTNIKEEQTLVIEEHLKRDFIRYYEVKDNKLIIYFSYMTLSTPYNKELELKILEKMKKQIIEHKDKRNDNYNTLLFGIYIINFLFQYTLSIGNKSIFNAIAGTSWLICSGLYGLPVLKNIIKKQDLEKHILFLENEEKLKEMIKKQMINLGIIDEYANDKKTND